MGDKVTIEDAIGDDRVGRSEGTIRRTIWVGKRQGTDDRVTMGDWW